MTQSSQLPKNSQLQEISTLEIAQALLERLSISLVFLLSEQPEEAQTRLEQATGWLNRSISAPPCPTHGQKKDG